MMKVMVTWRIFFFFLYLMIYNVFLFFSILFFLLDYSRKDFVLSSFSHVC